MDFIQDCQIFRTELVLYVKDAYKIVCSMEGKARKKNQQARECISEAIKLFEKCEADVYLKQAKDALESL